MILFVNSIQVLVYFVGSEMLMRRMPDPIYRDEGPPFRETSGPFRDAGPPFRDNGPFRDDGSSFRDDGPSFRDEGPPFRDDDLSYRDDALPYRNDGPSIRDEVPPFRESNPPFMGDGSSFDRGGPLTRMPASRGPPSIPFNNRDGLPSRGQGQNFGAPPFGMRDRSTSFQNRPAFSSFQSQLNQYNMRGPRLNLMDRTRPSNPNDFNSRNNFNRW